MAPQDVAPTLGRGIRWLYERLDGVKGEIIMRFASWFAIHLSNFGFTYKWEEWFGETCDDANGLGSRIWSWMKECRGRCF